MAKGYINWKLAIVLVVATCVCVGAGLILHDWQKNSRAEQARPLGMKAYEQENWGEAADQLGKYLAVNGDDVDILLKYGHAHRQIQPLRQNNVDQAISAYSTVLHTGTASDEEAYQATRWLVDMYLVRGKAVEAENRAKKYLENHDDPVIRRLLALAQGRQRKFEEGAETLSSLIDDHPEEVQAYGMLAALAGMQPDDVNEPPQYWFDKMLEANPDSALAHILYGRFLLGRVEVPDRKEKAREEFLLAENLDLSDADVRLELIASLVFLNEDEDYDRARDQIQKAIEETPHDSRLWSYWAKVAIASDSEDDPSISEDEMKKVAEAGLEALSAQPWDFLLWGVELLIRTSQFDKAQDFIVQLQNKDYARYRPRVYFLEGLLALKQEKPREAVAAWEKALALGYQSESDLQWRGEQPIVRMLLAAVQADLGNTTEAIAQLRAQVTETPMYAQAHLLLAQLQARKGDWAETLRAAREAQRVAPEKDDAIIAEAIKWELRARTVLQGGKTEGVEAGQDESWQDIERRLAQLEEQSDDSLSVGLLKAEAAIGRARLNEAADILDQLQKDYPDVLRPVLLRADVYSRQDKLDEAISLLTGSIDRFPQQADLVLALAGLLDDRGDASQCQSVLKAAGQRMTDPQVVKRIGLRLARYYSQWGQSDRYYEWTLALAEQFPDDISIKRSLLGVKEVLADTPRAQKIVDEIKALEGEGGRQWKIEQARVWMSSPDFLSRYSETVRLLQENLLADSDDQVSRQYLATAYGLKGEHQLAVMIWQEALNHASPTSAAYPNILLQTIVALYRAGQDEAAKTLLDKAEGLGVVQSEEFQTQVQKLRILGHLNSEDWNSASDILLEMLQEDPNDIGVSLSLAQTYARQGMFEDAHAVLDTIAMRHPGDVGVKQAKAKLYASQGDTDSALEICDAFVENQGSAVAYLLRGQMHDRFGQYERAMADYDKAVSLAPEQADPWAARARSRLNQQQIKEGIEDVQKALELAPDSVLIQSTAARLFLRSGNPHLIERGRALLEIAIDADTPDVGLKIDKARMLIEEGTSGSIEEARTLLTDMTQDESSPPEVWDLLATLAVNENLYADAIELASQGLSKYPDNAMLLIAKAKAEMLGHDPDSAVSTLGTLLDQDPNNLTVIQGLANAYLLDNRAQDALSLLQSRVPALTGQARRAGELIWATVLYRSGAVDQAKAKFESLIASDPNDSVPIVAWAYWMASGQQWDQVVALVERWRSKHPDDTRTPLDVAAGLLKHGDPESRRKAEEIARKTLSLHPDDLPTLRFMETIKTLSPISEDQVAAAALNRKILQIDPNNLVAMNNLAWFLCEKEQRYDEALKLANKGLAMDPRYTDLLDTRGVIYYRMNKLEEAERDLNRCISLCREDAPSIPTARLHVAKVYKELGRKTEAVQQLRLALDAQEKARNASPGRSLMSQADETEARQLLEEFAKGS